MSFPTDVNEFMNDPRISFSKLDNKWLLETDGREFNWEERIGHWVESVDEEDLRRHQEGFQYKGPINETVHPRDRKKRKQTQDHKDESQAKKPRVNTAVWVTSIPLDATRDEIRDVFAKFGMIAETMETGSPRIKMYCDKADKFKGEALVVYNRPESVPLAIQMLDDTDFRWGVSNPAGKMRVEEADSSYKREQTTPANLSKAERKRRQEMKENSRKKLADWGENDDAASARKPSESDKYVVLKHMFTLEQLQKDPAVRLEIIEDIHDEASKFGEVTKVVLYDEEPEGIVHVRFKDYHDAFRCAKDFDGRYFDRRYIKAYIWDGKEKFKKHSARSDAGYGLEETDQAEAERLEKFGAWLEGRENQESNACTEDSKNEDAIKEKTQEIENHDKVEHHVNEGHVQEAHAGDAHDNAHDNAENVNTDNTGKN